MATLLIQYSTSPAFASKLIRILTHSRWSHVDIVLPGEGLLGVSGPGKYTVGGKTVQDKGGVQIRPFEPWPYLYPGKIAEVITDAATVQAIIAAARSQIGKPFDNKALYSFLRDRAGVPSNKDVRDWRDMDQWFCSEFAIWSCETGKLFNYELVTTKEVVAPNDSLIMLNPYMSPQSISAFLP